MYAYFCLCMHRVLCIWPLFFLYQSLFQLLKRSLSLTGKHKRSEGQTNTEEESVNKKLKTETPTSTDSSLPPFDPNNPVGKTPIHPVCHCFCHFCVHLCFFTCILKFIFVCVSTGMEFLVPKTGFFCKVCNRFFSGTKEAEINHCKTLKHYENLQVGNTRMPSVICVLPFGEGRTQSSDYV